MKRILDACCGSRMFWFDKNNPDVIFADNRELETTLCDGRKLVIKPDVKMDFLDMPYAANSFKLVVFDPPHLIHAGESSWLAKKYGRLPKNWKDYIRRGVNECMRVLEPNGVLIFKWNEEEIKTSELLDAIDYKPLFGDKRAKTHWMCFMKADQIRVEALRGEEAIIELREILTEAAESESSVCYVTEEDREHLEMAIKALEQEARWIPVTERLPDDLEEVIVTWVNHNPEPYYEFIKNKPFVGAAVFYKGQWLWSSPTCVDYLAEYGRFDMCKMDDGIEITAWMPIPEPWKGEGNAK